MSTPFQNRLVGTIIVAAVVIIFLPDVLDGEKKSHQADFEEIPQVAAFSGEKIDKPFPEERLTRQKATPTVEEEAIDEPTTSEQSTTAEPEIVESVAIQDTKLVTVATQDNKSTNKPLPEKAVANEAWVIHLGSFKNKDNVEHLLKKLRANGYTAFTKPIKTKKGTLTKVIIGPELIKSAMIKKLPKLKQLTNIQGKVASFDVN